MWKSNDIYREKKPTQRMVIGNVWMRFLDMTNKIAFADESFATLATAEGPFASMRSSMRYKVSCINQMSMRVTEPH